MAQKKQLRQLKTDKLLYYRFPLESFFLLILALVVTSCLGPRTAVKDDHLDPIMNVHQPGFIPTQVDGRFGGASNAQLVLTSKMIRAWRTIGSARSHDPGDDFRKAGKPLIVSASEARRLRERLLDERCYLPPDISDFCYHTPGVVLTFSNENQDLDVFFCFECNALIVRTGSDKNGRSIFLDSLFYPGRGELVRIMKSIFSDDQEIQALVEVEKRQ